MERAWPVFLRVQIPATSATLSLVAAWRLTSASQLLGPLALSAGMWLLLGATLVSRGERSAGQSSLEAWAVTPNTGFWVVDGGGLCRIGRDDDRRAGQRDHYGLNAVVVHLMRR